MAGVFISAKTPRAIIQRIHGEITNALATPEVRGRIENLGAEPMSMTPAEFDKYVRAQADVAAAIIKQANIKAN